MAYRILEANNVENENIDGAAFNNFAAGNQSGIMGGFLSECTLSAAGNAVSVAPGCLLIHGIRVRLTAPEIITITSTPKADQQYQLIAQVVLADNNAVTFSLFAQISGALVQDDLFVDGSGTYQLELGRFKHSTDGSITDVVRVAPVIYGCLKQEYADYLEEQLYKTPSIKSFTVTTESSVSNPAEVGQIFTPSGFTHYEENTENISGTLKLAMGGSVIMSNIAVSEESVTVPLSVQGHIFSTDATLTIRLSGTDRKGKTFYKDYTRSAYYPFYYGGSDKASLTAGNIVGLTKAQSITGTKEITLSSNGYLYFCCHESKSVHSVVSLNESGAEEFEVPMNAPVTVSSVLINGLHFDYKVYRSESLIQAGTYKYKVS
nr:MAG TPA: hypothetical protein [Caudoviricetes sp.]